MMTPFSKMHGLGNDFVVFESLTQNIHINPTMVRKIADRHTGIGCDQLLVIGPPGDGACDFSVRYFNADGSEAEQCGNGLRCAARYVFDKKFTGKRSLQLQTATGVMALDINDDNSITANMGQPELEPAQVPFSASPAIGAIPDRGGWGQLSDWRGLNGQPPRSSAGALCRQRASRCTRPKVRTASAIL